MNLRDRSVIEGIWNKLDVKLENFALHSNGKMPRSAKNGVYDDKSSSPWAWTQGFFPCMMWLMYDGTKKECYKNAARIVQEKIRGNFNCTVKQHHDAGFIWHISSGADYRLTGDEIALNDNLLAASILASRYNISGGYIRAWDESSMAGDNDNLAGWAIIDSMMNIPLLYWAGRQTGDDRFKTIAMRHADKTLANHIRPDGSVKHIVEYNPLTGEWVKNIGGQGYSPESSWSRGQAWALYGFVISYIHTGETRYLDAAKRVAHYYISAVSDTWTPLCDFRAPAAPVIYDVSSGMIAACGLIELSRLVPEYEKDLYYNPGLRLIGTATENYADFSENTENILTGYSAAYWFGDKNTSVIYADSFYVEAINKLMGFNTFLW